MSNESALAQYQKNVDDDCYEADFIESKFIEAREKLQADILEMLKSKRYHKRYVDFFTYWDFESMEHVFNDDAKVQFACRFERDGD